MRKLFLASITALFCVFAYSQEFQVPANYSLVNAEDYAVYEQDVVNGINWLANTPIDQDVEKRKEVNAFLMSWMMGSPEVKIVIRQDIVNFLSNPDLLMAFLGGWTRYSLETRDFTNEVKNNVAGIENVIFVYNKNRRVLGKNSNVERYIRLQRQGKLEQEIAKRLAR
jgi:hypothetical protein